MPSHTTIWYTIYMKIIEHRIQYKYGDVIKIGILADVHIGHKLCDERAFKSYLSETSSPNTYYIGNGDLLDSIITTDKRYRKSMDESPSDAIVDDQISRLHSILEPYKDNIISLGDGNHERTICRMCGTKPIKRLAERLGCHYNGISGIIILRLREGEGRGRTVLLYHHHGWGGASRTEGGDITKYARHSKQWRVDFCIYGHCHKLHTEPWPEFDVVGTKLVSRPKNLIINGTFQKTLSIDENPSWAEEMGFPGVDIGAPLLHIKPTDNSIKTWAETMRFESVN